MANNYSQVTVSPYLPARLFQESELEALAVCGLHHERDNDMIYFFAEEFFCEEDHDENDQHIDSIAILQSKLRMLDPADTPHLTIEGATTCSKMRQGEFGGFAYLITREEVCYFSTWQWLFEQTEKGQPQHPGNSASEMLAALEAVLPYAEAEAAALQECWKRDGDPRVKQEADTCEQALGQARDAIARARATERRPS